MYLITQEYYLGNIPFLYADQKMTIIIVRYIDKVTIYDYDA